jgi:glycosyltransferase involved in cell wall biosynthesis
MYLDRCIRSIKAHARGYGTIIVLDDGSEEKFLEKIAQDHEDIIIRGSPNGAKKRQYVKDNYAENNNLRREVTDMGFDPAAFWVEEIKKDDNSFVLVMEDDTWFRESIDIVRVVKNMEENNTLIFKLMLCGRENAGKGSDVDIRVLFDDGFAMDYYTPLIKEILDVYQIFILCLAIYRKNYWINNFEGVGHYLDEIYTLNRALEYVMKLQSENVRVRFARSASEIIHQSHMTTCRTDSGGMGVPVKIDNSLYNKAIDEAWLKGDLDPMSNFPDEIADDYLTSVFRRSLSDEEIGKWLLWRKSYNAMFDRIFEKM